MVATKLHEVTSKGIDWATGSAGNSPSKMDSSRSTLASSASNNAAAADDEGYLSFATNSLWNVYDQTQETLTGLMSSLYTDSSSSAIEQDSNPAGAVKDKEKSSALDKNDWRRKATNLKLKYPELEWLLKNPYSSVRGIDDRPSSLSAVRSLLVHVHHLEKPHEKEAMPRLTQDETLATSLPEDDALVGKRSSHVLESSTSSIPDYSSRSVRQVSKSETAQKLAEGSLRAIRDLTLMEAVELHSSLKYWTVRWERPLLSWLEAGPWVWFSQDGYNHQLVGQRVSQIQAVLARRCASIGELQQHLLRAGWQKGVAQWGVIGQGEQWAQVAGGDGTMDDSSTEKNGQPSDAVRKFSTDTLDEKQGAVRSRRRSSLIGISVDEDNVPQTSSMASVPEQEEPLHAAYYGHAKIPVKNTRGGEILKDDPALAAWSVDAMRLIRDQLYKAGNRAVPLPYSSNWADEEKKVSEEDEAGESQQDGIEILPQISKMETANLPAWATQSISTTDADDDRQDDGVSQPKTAEVRISDLPLMASEVSELLNSMEDTMELQKNRRLEKLKPPPDLRRNWYITAVGLPVGTYVLWTLLKDAKGLQLAKEVIHKISSFYQEHVSEPLRAVFYELFTRRDRETISDRKARMDAIESCKHMIKSWLDETYPEMDEAERQFRADTMDFSLIEKKKEESIKTIFEINSVVRMSLIEIQFIKKELMNALYAMDEMITSNEININLAAVTPAVMVLYAAKYTFHLLFYALLKIGRSKEETYASFRQIILDMERLLLMRDNPPTAPPPLGWVEEDHAILTAPNPSRSVLTSDDLGMVVLLIHECRAILWRDRRRFSPMVLRNVSEDLAELAGERGPVSVQQQLQIISRMCRTYPFLKVISAGVDLNQAILP